ncbi:MAG: nitrous oxide reductase family maturation protein NosD [Chloroflexi bacterium]|nr:nitrous oxide reductase family maturation protein NosD [Chloroflexota bacterium]
MLNSRAGKFTTTTAILLLLVAIGSSVSIIRAQSTNSIESERGTYATFQDAIDDAQNGDVLTITSGTHNGNFVITKSITVIGNGWPVFDGGGDGNVITVEASDVAISGLVIQNSGGTLNSEDAGIEVNAPNVTIEGNRIQDTLFGVYLKQAPFGVIRNNVITGMDLEVQRRGDGIRVWYSSDTVIENNDVSLVRDVVLWYSERLTVKGNNIYDGRYGLHFMYDDDALVENNRLTGNSVGAFLMYSRRLRMIDNVVGDNRGPSGYGIGLKDLDDAYVKGNLFADNRVGAYVDNSPRERDSTVEFIDNVFVLNDFGVRIMPSVKRNQYTGNSFVDNQEQVQVAGRGTLKDNLWAVDGVGNYWSDYAGFDANNDGIGDVIYKSEKLFENLTDKHPKLRLLTFSPVTQAVDFAAKSFPFVRPEPKLTDPSPLMQPGVVPGLVLDNKETNWKTLIASLAFIGLAGLVARLGVTKTTSDDIPEEKSVLSTNNESTDLNVIEVNGLTRSFGDVKALQNLSFTLAQGEGLALWGNNGAGKTTAIRCILGQVSFEGSVSICGIDVRTSGKQARAKVGLVPQEISFHDDLTVIDTMRLYTRLRKARHDEGSALLERLSLAPHLTKQVRQLSGGLRQRLALAIALLGDPPILLLDEPTANLDAAARQDFLALLEELKSEGKALVFASHRPGEVLRLADRVLLLDQGKLVAESAPEDLMTRIGALPKMRIEVGLDNVDSAMSALGELDFEISRNRTGIYVTVTPGAKAKPIKVLVDAGISVIDFDLEGTGKGDIDD